MPVVPFPSPAAVGGAAVAVVANAAGLPSAPNPGDQVFRLDTHHLYTWTGLAWEQDSEHPFLGPVDVASGDPNDKAGFVGTAQGDHVVTNTGVWFWNLDPKIASNYFNPPPPAVNLGWVADIAALGAVTRPDGSPAQVGDVVTILDFAGTGTSVQIKNGPTIADWAVHPTFDASPNHWVREFAFNAAPELPPYAAIPADEVLTVDQPGVLKWALPTVDVPLFTEAGPHSRGSLVEQGGKLYFAASAVSKMTTVVGSWDISGEMPMVLPVPSGGGDAKIGLLPPNFIASIPIKDKGGTVHPELLAMQPNKDFTLNLVGLPDQIGHPTRVTVKGVGDDRYVELTFPALGVPNAFTSRAPVISGFVITHATTPGVDPDWIEIRTGAGAGPTITTTNDATQSPEVAGVAPATPAEGDRYVNTLIGVEWVYTGGAWVRVGQCIYDTPTPPDFTVAGGPSRANNWGFAAATKPNPQVVEPNDGDLVLVASTGHRIIL